jgi:hypothetical protein
MVKRLQFKYLMNPKLRCFNCETTLDWLYYEENNENITYGCTTCLEPHKTLQCLPKDINLLMKLSKNVHPQLFAPILYSIMYHINFLNRFSSPYEVDNPLTAIQEIYEHSPKTFKLGGPNVVILIDIHFGSKPFNCPIIYIADTETVPTKMILFALDTTTAADVSDRNNIIIDYFKTFVRESKIINKNSNLVIGPNLERILETVNFKELNHNCKNFEAIIKFQCLINLYALRMDPTSPRVILNLKYHVLSKCDEICIIVDGLMKSYAQKPAKEIYEATQKYLTIANWLRYFWETPFETMIYYFQNTKWDE